MYIVIHIPTLKKCFLTTLEVSMRRSLSLLCSVLFCSSLWAEDYIPFSQPTWTKENPKTALYIMPRSIDREDRDQSYLMVLVDSWGDGWNGASALQVPRNIKKLHNV